MSKESCCLIGIRRVSISDTSAYMSFHKYPGIGDHIWDSYETCFHVFMETLVAIFFSKAKHGYLSLSPRPTFCLGRRHYDNHSVSFARFSLALF